MDLSTLTFDPKEKLITIEGISPRQTVEAVKELIQENKIDPFGFQGAYFSYKPGKGPEIEFTKYYSSAPYHRMIIKTINLKNTEPEIGEFTDVDCAIEILKLLNLFIFEAVESVLKTPSDYIKKSGGGYEICVEKSGLLRWESPYLGARFIYD